jgi:hypothetical protein
VKFNSIAEVMAHFKAQRKSKHPGAARRARENPAGTKLIKRWNSARRHMGGGSGAYQGQVPLTDADRYDVAYPHWASRVGQRYRLRHAP